MGVSNYKFRLEFENIESFNDIDITEPIKFDGASFVLEQDKERYGRDIFFLNENIDLFFYKGNYDLAENPLQLPNGTIVNNLTQGFEFLIEAKNQKGYEVSCKFIIYDGVDEFAFGVLDYQTSETDEYSYFKCKVLQSTEKQLIKRRADYVVDVFSDETPDEEYIEPLQTTNILLKAKPTINESEWTTPQNYAGDVSNLGTNDFFYAFNFISNPIKYGIENTLSYIYGFKQIFVDDDLSQIADFIYIDAQDDLTNGSIEIEDIDITFSNYNTSTGYVGLTGCKFRIYYLIGSEFNYNNKTQLFSVNLDSSQEYNYTGNFTITQDIPSGYKFWFWFEFDTPVGSTIGVPNTIYNYNFKNNAKVSAKYVATAIDTVIKGVRWIDLIKQNVKSISNLDVYAPLLDNGGKHYNNFAFSGNLIKGRDDVAFSTKFKDLMETIKEVNLDYQVLDDKVFIGQYSDFYTNKEIISLPMYPDDSFVSRFNDRFALNLAELNYTTYEQDRDETNTSDSVHTETQWTVQNKQVENSKVVKLPQIRDYNKIESTKKEAVKVTTSTSDDDKLYLLDCVPLAPNTVKGFTASMTHNINDEGNVQLLKDADLPSWGVLGFSVGSNFTIVSGFNSGTYTVENITDTIITLNPVSPPTQSQTGVSLTEVSYPLDNVLFTNRTNEGFAEIDGIISSEKSSNLKYTPKRNLLEWETYLASAILFTNNQLKNSYYKVNQYTTTGLETRLNTETVNLIEKDNLELNNPILSAKEYDLTLVASFNDMVTLLNALNTINDDDTIGGFLRCYNPDYRVIKGFVKKLDYEPATEKLTVTLEELYQSDIIEITTNGNSITVNDVNYNNVINGYSWFEFNGDYFIIFDSDNAPIIEPTIYSKISFNGVIYDSVIELNQALLDA